MRGTTFGLCSSTRTVILLEFFLLSTTGFTEAIGAEVEGNTAQLIASVPGHAEHLTCQSSDN
jgi:hypothetical protein